MRTSPQRMAEAPLREVLQFQTTIVHPKDRPTGECTFVGLEHIERDTGRRLGSEEVLLEELTGRRARFRRGDIVYGYLRPYLNKVWIAEFDGICSVDQYVLAVRPCADLNYVAHFLRSETFLKRAPVAVSPGQLPRLRSSELLDTLIPLPPLDEQRRIAAILDQADALRNARRRSMEGLKRFRRAYFAELFGDPIANPKGWPIQRVQDAIVSVTNGLTRRAADDDIGRDTVLRLRDIRDGEIDLSEPSRITLTTDEKGRFAVSIRDLLFVRVNGNPDYVGRCAVFQGGIEPIYFNDHIMRVRLNEQALNPTYLQDILSTEFGRRQVARHKRTSAGQHTINQEGLSSITFPFPPIELQRAFEVGVERLHVVRDAITRERAKLDTLFASLQHRAFSGELTAKAVQRELAQAG